MTLQSGKIDQKEYLKRYLSGTSDEKKKKKKKIATGIKRVKIIDDDIDLKNMRNLDSNELELYQLSEDAPVIAGVVDERPPEVQQADKYKDKRWKVITGGSDDDVQISDKNEPKNKTKISGLKNNRNLDISPPRKSKPMSKKLGPDFSEFRKSRKKSPSSDQSPPRKSRQNSDSDMSPPRKSNNRARENSDSDMSPDRKPSKKSRQNSDSDISPPRKSNKKSRKNSDSDISPPRKVSKKSRHNSDSDMSPPRKSNKKSRQNLDSDTSPPRKFSKKSRQNSDSDISPPRKSNKKSRKNSDSDISPPRKSNNHKISSKNNSQKTRNDDISPHRHSRRNSDSDLSTPRKSRPEKEINRNQAQSRENLSLSRKETKSNRNRHQENSDSDLSPPRKSRKETNTSSKFSQRNSDSDLSPPRKSRKETSKYKSRGNSDSDLSPPRKSKNNAKNSSHKSRNDGSDSDLSPPRKQKSDSKMKKTLDGKQAGLQDAKQLVQENQEFKRREDDLFRKMAASVSGADASTVLRDRKTGRVRDLEEEARESRKRNEKDSEHKEKYDKWGRGVKQGQEFQARIKQDLHEMAKPLARYRDDEDLERDLKETLRAEDPMLQYVLSKKEKSEADLKPKYKGAWPPNRFNIPPGYRWDGVDRSSGYEKQLFLSKSAKKATEEEAYHWSISDM